MKKLPYGISNYEELKQDGYYYVDKTQYIEKLENLAQKRIMFLRPRKFGKTLFTSVIENYYDIRKKDKFELLYGDTYIGKHPTKLKNRYHILRFNFSGIDTDNEDTTIKGFKNKTIESIKVFINQYHIDFFINEAQEAEEILNSVLTAFRLQKPEEKIYVIIDEYDHFANELLSFRTEQFKTLVSKNGKVRKWYEILKQGTETVIDRIFITGVAPITLDSLTSGFNISFDMSRDEEFNEMIGFTKDEVIRLMDTQNISKETQEELLPILKENYDGYQFCITGKEKVYNSNMCLYFLNGFQRYEEIPRQLVDVNIASDYTKLGKMLELCKGEKGQKIIEQTVSGGKITSQITEKFNPAIEFTQEDLVSMLYYLGYLTIAGENFGVPELTVPNKVMKEIYADYFMQILKKETEFAVQQQDYVTIAKELAEEGKIDKMVELVGTYLNNLSNRDYIKFDEKYVKLIFYCIAMNLKIFRTKSEMEVQRKYPDLLIMPREKEKGYYSVMVEFKYLKKEEESRREEKRKEAKEQIKEYANMEEIKQIDKIKKYTIIAINDCIYAEEII